MELKRGEISWVYFPIAYNILLTISVGLLSVLEIQWFYKFILIIIASIVLFRLCFFNSWFRNKIVEIFTKSKDFIEKF